MPPPPEEVRALLEDLAAFCERDDLPPILQAAVGHVQYETIHPFMDGNGRAGRALIGMVLIRRRVCHRALPPISLVLASQTDRYVRGLRAYRYGDGSDWFELFAWAVSRAAAASEELAERVGELKRHWAERAGGPRARSAAAALIEALPAHPVLTFRTAQAITERSGEACRRALNALEGAEVLKETTAARRNRVWESVGLFDLLDTLEREAGDSLRAPAPTR